MNRGASRSDIFRDDADRVMFLECLAASAQRTAMEIHCFCLMSNHFHVLLRSLDGKLSDFLRLLTGRYVHEFNRRWRKDGPLFRDRAKTIEIESDAQLLGTSRYIHLNPVSAGLVRSVFEWPWSSASTYCGKKAGAPSWLVMSEVLDMLGGEMPTRSYESFLAEGIDAKTTRFYGEQRFV